MYYIYCKIFYNLQKNNGDTETLILIEPPLSVYIHRLKVNRSVSNPIVRTPSTDPNKDLLDGRREGRKEREKGREKRAAMKLSATRV